MTATAAPVPVRLAGGAVEVGAKSLAGSAGICALGALEPGAGGRLVGVGAPAGSRLFDLGFVPGTEIRMLRRAPLGDPVELELRGYRICLRADDLEGLEVEPLERTG